MKLSLRRIAAWLMDWAGILGWGGVTAGVGVPLYRAGWLTRPNRFQLNLIAALVMVVPVVVVAALLESRPAAATPGKRTLGLVVQTVEGRPAFRTALSRNTLKTGIPWLLGHATAFALAARSRRSGPVPARLWMLTAAAYALPVIYVASLFVGDGRTPYDRITGTRVIGRSDGPQGCPPPDRPPSSSSIFVRRPLSRSKSP